MIRNIFLKGTIGIIVAATLVFLAVKKEKPEIIDKIWSIENTIDSLDAERNKNQSQPIKSEIDPSGQDINQDIDEEFFDEDQNNINDDSEEMDAATQADKVTAEPNIMLEVSQYRNYLTSTNQLVINFWQNAPYTNELQILVSKPLPKNLDEIINLLGQYNTMLTNHFTDNTRIFPKNHTGIEHLLKIEKINPHKREMDILRAKLIDRMNILISYIYSEEMQEHFVDEGSNQVQDKEL